MRFELGNTQELRVSSNTSPTSLLPIAGRGLRGFPGPGSAAWSALQTITTGEVRQAPDGSWIRSLANRTTGATFDTTEAGFWAAVLGTSGTIEAKALDATYGAVTLATATADGATNVHTAFAADVTAARAAGRVLQLNGGTYRDSTSVQAITGSVRIDGRGATFSKNHAGNAFDIEPTGVSGGTTTAGAAAGDTTVTRTGAGWTVNEHAGKWVNLADGSHPESRKVVSNTATVLTLDEALGNTVASGSAITFFTPIDLVEINDLTIDDATGSGSANLIIRYAKKVRLRRLKSTNCGGNGITIYWCDDVVTEDIESDNTNFGCFAYYCGRVEHIRPKPKNWKSSYGFQIKDCREYGVIRDGLGVGDGVNSLTAFDVKCSGLNPGRNLSIVNCWAKATTQAGLMMHTIQNEGTVYGAENYSIIGGGASDCGTGVNVLAAAPYESGEATGAGKFFQAQVRDVQVIRSTSGGVSIAADNVSVTGLQVSRGQVRAVTVTGSKVRMQARLTDNNLSGTSAEELRLDGASDCDLDVAVIHTDNSSGTTRGVRELNTCDRNEVRLRIKDTATTAHMTSDALLVGASSKVLRMPAMDATDSGISLVGIDVKPTTARLTAAQTLSTTTLADLTGLSRSVHKGGVYKFRVVLMADADIADDITVNFTYPSGTTGWYQAMSGPSTSATASNNQQSRFQGTKTFQNIAVGLIGVGTYAPVAIEGEITVTTAGTFQVQAAQLAHTTGNTIVQAGHLTTEKIV